MEELEKKKKSYAGIRFVNLKRDYPKRKQKS
jgi:hypothetical protein